MIDEFLRAFHALENQKFVLEHAEGQLAELKRDPHFGYPFMRTRMEEARGRVEVAKSVYNKRREEFRAAFQDLVNDSPSVRE